MLSRFYLETVFFGNAPHTQKLNKPFCRLKLFIYFVTQAFKKAVGSGAFPGLIVSYASKHMNNLACVSLCSSRQSATQIFFTCEKIFPSGLSFSAFLPFSATAETSKKLRFFSVALLLKTIRNSKFFSLVKKFFLPVCLSPLFCLFPQQRRLRKNFVFSQSLCSSRQSVTQNFFHL